MRTDFLALFLLALLFLPAAAQAAVQFDAATTTTGASISSRTWLHTVANQSNRVLIVGVQAENGSIRHPSGVTYNGVALTQINTANVGSGTRQCVSLWYLLAPAVGTANVVVTWSSSVSNATAGAISLYNVAQAAPEANATSVNNSGATTTNITTLTDGAWVVDMFGSGNGGGLSAAGGQTARFTNTSGSTTAGGGSTKPVATAGATSVTWSQAGGVNRSAGVAASFAPVNFRPDVMIRLTSEADSAYLTDNTYEAAASVQVKSQGAVSGSTAAYAVKFQNDSTGTDSLVITGTGNGSGFTVQYLDDTSTDRTAAVTGAGYTISSLAVGATKDWTLKVTPGGSVTGNTSYNVYVTATSSTDGTRTDQVKAITTSTSAVLTLLKSADKANVNPGEEIAYTVTASNGAGLSAASSVVMTDPIPANTGFKIAGATFNAGTSTLTNALSYSDDGGSTWTYTPASGGCSAPAGYDYCVNKVKWTTSGNMPTGTSFSIGLVVVVK